MFNTKLSVLIAYLHKRPSIIIVIFTFLKIFEGEMLARIQPTTTFQIFLMFILYSKINCKGEIDLSVTFEGEL